VYQVGCVYYVITWYRYFAFLKKYWGQSTEISLHLFIVVETILVSRPTLIVVCSVRTQSVVFETHADYDAVSALVEERIVPP
jgi:hypothetical protein